MDEEDSAHTAPATRNRDAVLGLRHSGTRFHVYPWPGAARTVGSASTTPPVHSLTGCCPTVAIHVPWDEVDDWGELRRHAEDQGIAIGAVNPNVFGDDEYRSEASAPSATSRQALGHCRECVEIAQGSTPPSSASGSLDGTN